MKNFTALMIGIAALAPMAQATNLQFEHMDLGNAESVGLTYNSHYESVYDGKIDFTDGTHQYVTVCADVASLLNGSYNPYNISETNPAGSSAIDFAGRIVAENFGAANTADQQAGLQLAVWSSLYNGLSSFSTTGALTISGASSGALADANTYFASGFGSVGSAVYYASSANGAQSQLTAQAVPEPASFIAIAVGVVGLIRRRK